MKRRTGSFLGHFFPITAALLTLPFLTGAKSDGCSAGGDVPVGSEDNLKFCGPTSCDGLPVLTDAKICSDGTGVGRSVCAKGNDGNCFWDFPACPAVDSGTPSTCDCTNLAATTEAKICPDGTGVGRSVCAKSSAGTCFWDFPACPAVDAGHPSSCSPADCANLPADADAKICPDGTGVGRTVCARNAGGSCFWDFPACPASPSMDAGPAMDSGDCGCVPDMEWGQNGGLVAYADTTTLTSCTAYQHARSPREVDGGSPSCAQTLLACGSGLHSGRDILTLLNSQAVQAAIQAAPVLYGVDPRPWDGTVLRIQIGTAIIDVGLACNGASGCVAVPSDIAALASLLQAIDDQELRLAPCSTVFPQP